MSTSSTTSRGPAVSRELTGHELLGLPVVGPGGEDLGQVQDVRLVQDGPPLGAFAALRVEGVVVGRQRVGSRLGYDRYDVHGPWLVRAVVDRLTARNGYLRWEDVTLEEGSLSAHCLPGDVPSIR